LKINKELKNKNVNECSELKTTKENTQQTELKENLKLKDTEIKENLEQNTKKISEQEKTVKPKEESSNITTKDEIIESPEEIANKRIEKKKELYRKLWEKEYEYADVLVRMLQSFRKPLIDDANSENPTINLSQIDTLFDGFDDILNLSWSLCGELKIVYNLYKQLKPVNIGILFFFFFMIFI